MLRPAFVSLSGSPAYTQIADIMSLFALLHQSLHNGKPLPPMMPIFERLGYHSLSHSGSREGSWGKALRSAKSAEVDASKTSEKASMAVDGGEGQVDAEHSTVDHEEEKVVKALSSEMTIDMAKVSDPGIDEKEQADESRTSNLPFIRLPMLRSYTSPRV